MHLIIPKDYNPVLNTRDTEIAIKLVKDFFERELARQLNLTRVSAPIMVTPQSGLNDNLNGVERPVDFDILETGERAEIVHSLAKWKRMALKTYGFAPGEGLYTDMNAIRRDEITDNIHSIFVDQWDWERILTPQERNEATLRAIVEKIYETLQATEDHVCAHYPHITPELPKHIAFVYVTLVLSMLIGRAVWGLASAVLMMGTENVFTTQAFLAGAFINAWPGIILHILVIPPVVLGLRRAKLMD